MVCCSIMWCCQLSVVDFQSKFLCCFWYLFLLCPWLVPNGMLLDHVVLSIISRWFSVKIFMLFLVFVSVVSLVESQMVCCSLRLPSHCLTCCTQKTPADFLRPVLEAVMLPLRINEYSTHVRNCSYTDKNPTQVSCTHTDTHDTYTYTHT